MASLMVYRATTSERTSLDGLVTETRTEQRAGTRVNLKGGKAYLSMWNESATKAREPMMYPEMSSCAVSDPRTGRCQWVW